MFLLIFLLYILPAANATLAERIKRFLTPSTYPVPTTFAVPSTMNKRTNIPIASSFTNARPISCPVKRDTRSKRVLLNSNMMREIYLQEVGAWDKRLVAETLEEAKDNFIDLTNTSYKKYESLVRKKDVLNVIIRHLLEHHLTNSTSRTNSGAKRSALDTRRHYVTGSQSKTIQLGTVYDPLGKQRTKRTSDGNSLSQSTTKSKSRCSKQIACCSLDSTQPVRMCRLILTFAGCIRFLVDFVVHWFNYLLFS